MLYALITRDSVIILSSALITNHDVYIPKPNIVWKPNYAVRMYMVYIQCTCIIYVIKQWGMSIFNRKK